MTQVSWKSAVSGNWTTAADWSTGTIPAATDDATLGYSNGYTVSITSPIAVGSIDVTNKSATLSVNASGQTVTVAGDLLDGGALLVDWSGGQGGTSLSIAGTLTSSNFVGVGNTSLSAPTLVSANALVDTGTIEIFGSTSKQATLDITAAAGFGVAGVLTGTLNMGNDALLEFGSGQISTIANNATLTLEGPQAFVADSGSTGSNSALTGLSENDGTLNLHDGASLSVSGNLDNASTINVDNYGADSGSGLSIAGTLTNMGGLNIGDTSLTAADTVTIGGLDNTGTIGISGNASTGKQGALEVNAAAGFGAPGVLTGNIGLSGDALLEFASGQITTIANNATLTLEGPQALVADSGSTGSNSALTGLSENDGTLNLHDGASLSVSGNLDNAGTINVDNYGADSGSGLSIAGTLTNMGGLNIGDTSLTAADTVTIGGLDNTGTIGISGNASTGKQGALEVNAAAGFGAPGVLTGNIGLSGDALLEFASGQITTIANNATLTLEGPQALVADSGSTGSNSALTGLSENDGTLNLHDGASLSVSGNLDNAGTINVDNYGADSGSGLSIAGTLTNVGGLNIGDTSLTAADTVTIGGLVDAGTINLSGSTSYQATLTVNGLTSVTGNVDVGSGSSLNITGGNDYTEVEGTTAVTGALGATAVNVICGTLDGTGVITGNVDDTGGIIKAGTNSPGTLTLDGNLLLGGTGVVDATIAGTSSNQISTIDVSGSVSLQGGILDVNFSNFTPVLGQTFTLMTFAPGDLSGTFGTIEDGGFVGDGTGVNISSGLRLALNYNSAGGEITAQVVSASAADTWNGSNANWSTASDWSTSAVPGSSDNAVLGGSSGYTVSITAPITPVASLDISDTINGTLSINNTTTGLASGDVTNVGTLNVDSSDNGGSAVSIGGTLRNGGIFRIGNSGITSSVSVTASGLDNLANNGSVQGTIDLTGNTAAGSTDQALLSILAPAPTVWTGQLNLSGDASLHFASGGVAAIGANSGLTVNGAAPQVSINGNTGNNNALDTLAANAGTLDLIAGASITTNSGVDFDNTGTILLDEFIQPGGSSLTIGGALTNSGNLEIGNSGELIYDTDGIIAPDTVTARGLDNSGSIVIGGSTAAVNPPPASLNILAAAPATLTGSYSLTGNALLQFASGFITTIASNSSLQLDGSAAQVAISGNTGNNNALDTLAENDGTLTLRNNASITTNSAVDFDNTGQLNIGNGDFQQGGSTLTIGGVLTNSGDLSIGNGDITGADTVTAAGLNNLVAENAEINLDGNPAQALLNILGVAPTTLTGTFDLSGNALLQFASGGITTIGGGSSLTINGAAAQVAISGGTGSNNALDTLAENDGNLHLADGASLTTNPGLNFDNTGAVGIDNGDFDAGGSSLTIGGVLTNSGEIFLGNSGNASETLTAGGLDNLVASGAFITLAGNSTKGSPSQALLNILSAAPSTLTGTFNLSGNSLLQFASGGITDIDGNFTLNGSAPQVAISGNTGNNSAFDTLAENDGSLVLENGAAVATNAGTDFDNTGNLQVDAGGSGGGSLSIGGVLTNTGNAQIGNDGLTAATPLTASGLDNTAGTFGISDSTVTLAGALDNSGTLNIGDGGISLTTTLTAATLDNIETGTIAVTGSSSGANASLVIEGLADNAANFEINPGGIAEVGSLDNTGTISLSGNADTPSNLGVIGSATNDGTINIGAFAQAGITGNLDDAGAITLAGTLDVGGAMTVNSTGSVSMQGGSLIGSGNITVDAGGTVSGNGTISVGTTNDGTMTASGGFLDVAAPIAGTGQLNIGSGAEFEIGGATAEGISFGGNVGTAKFDTPASVTGPITGLVKGDTLDLAGVQATGAVVSGSTLTVTAGSQTLTYQVSGLGLSGNVFAIESDGSGGSDLVLGPPGPAVDAPNAQTVFTGLPVLLGPISIADPSAGNSSLTVTVSDASGLLSAAAAGAGTVSGKGTNALTLTGDLDDINTMLASLTLAEASAGADTVQVQVTDANNLTTAQSIAVTTEYVPFTEPVLNAPATEITILGTPTALGGLSISDPYAQTTGGELTLQEATSLVASPPTVPAAATFTVTGTSGAIIIGQGTSSVTVSGTPAQINSDFADADLVTLLKTVIVYIVAALNEELPFKPPPPPPKPPPPVVEPIGPPKPPPYVVEPLVEGQAGSVERAAAEEIGDAHTVTFSGQVYDFNTVGEFILSESRQPGNSFDVQVRLQPVNNSKSASVITQVAAALGSDRVTFGIGRSEFVWVDGSPFPLASNSSFNLAGGQLARISTSTYQLTWNTGEIVTVTDNGSYLDIGVGLGSGDPQGSVMGLMGPDAGQANDFSLPDGTVLQQPLSVPQLYGTFANAWRVTPATSLFDYGPGQSTATFTDESFPETAVTLADLPESIVAQAAQAAAAAGITDPGAAAAAEFDYLATGNPNFIGDDASVFQGITTSPASVTPSGAIPVVLGVLANSMELPISQNGSTPVTFEVYLTSAESSDTEVDYIVIAPNSIDLGASAFGGTLPSGSVTLAAGTTSGTFTINVPQGALGGSASADLAVQISTPSGVPIFAPDGQVTLLAPQPGAPPVPQLVDLTNFGNLTQDGNNYTLNLGAVQFGETLPTLQFAIENAANAPADELTGTITWSTVAGFAMDVDGTTTSGVSLPSPIAAGQSFDGLTATINQEKFGANSQTITFNPVDTNASGYSAPLSPLTLTIEDTLELPGMIYSQAFGDVHILTYNGLNYNFQDTGDFVLAQSRIPGDNFQIQMQLAPWYSGASVTTIQEVAIALGSDDVTFAWSRANTVLVDGAATTLSMANPTLTLSGGTITEVSPTMFNVSWNTGETMTVSYTSSWASFLPSFIDITDGIPGNAGPGAYAGLQGEDEGTQNDIQLADGQVLPQPVSTAELYGEYANSWAVTPATSLFDAPLIPMSAPTDPLTLADLPQNLVNQAAALVASAGITDPGIAADAELDYLATGDPAFITADANVQQLVFATTPATVTASTTPAIAVGVMANAASVTEATSGDTAVTFTAYLTGAEASDAEVDYTVVAPGTGYLGASAFGGTLPSGSVTIAAGQTTAQFTIEVPQGALGSDPSDNLQVQVGDPAGIPIFAPTAQTEIVNNQPEPSNPASASARRGERRRHAVVRYRDKHLHA